MTKKVLLLDDDPGIRLLYSEDLTDEGYDVIVVIRGYCIAVKGFLQTMRLTEVSHKRQKLRKISFNILKRESIGSLSNCYGCHTKAEEGIYDGDHVIISK